MCFCKFTLVAKNETNFAIIVASYNNEPYVEWNLESLLNQNYDESKFHIYYMNDMSTDKTLQKAKDIIHRYDAHHLVTFIDNKIKRYQLGNYYYCIHNLIKDENTVVLTVDGDDALAHSNVLSYLDTIYSKLSPKIYLTYGQFIQKNSKKTGFCQAVSRKDSYLHKFRKIEDAPSHLRTFYAWLFKKIRKDDLLYENNFPIVSGDLAMMLPMIEMANGHFQFISEILYIYNDCNPISDHVKNKALQWDVGNYFRRLTPYMPLDPQIAKNISSLNKNSFIRG